MENKYRCWIKNEGFIIERICVARSRLWRCVCRRGNSKMVGQGKNKRNECQLKRYR